MIYVYIKNWWIIHKNEKRLQTVECDNIIMHDWNITDQLIYEDYTIKEYKKSDQYIEDQWIEWIREANERLKKELHDERIWNEQLMTRHIKLRTEFDLLRTNIEND